MRTVLVVALALAGCIEAELVPCGERACPAGSTCVEGSLCATDEQLAACAGDPDGALCVTTRGNGTCRSGVCVTDRCGDGVVDPGETCDDGNLASGDGCRQDCRSDESCGNGTLDLGESCDCGNSAATLAQGCATANSNDPTAQCDLGCTRRCGDGAVTGSEQCDGSNVPVSCAQLGYYEGTSACTSYCALDPAGCSGRCGDHVVQADHGEECDGSRPATGTCVTYGRDYGILRCSSFCGPDIAGSCAYLGHKQLIPTSDTVDKAAANRRGAIALATTGEIIVSWDGVVSRRAGTGWTEVVASGPHLIGIGTTSYGWFDGTWHDRTISLTATPMAATTSTGIAYLVFPDCSVAQLTYSTGAMASLPSIAATSCTTPRTVFDQLHVAAGAAGIVRWNGVAWTTVLAQHTTAIERATPSHVIARGTSRFYDVDLGLTPAVATQITKEVVSVVQLVSDQDGMLVGLADDLLPYVYTDHVIGFPEQAAGDATRITRTEDGTVISFGSGVARFEPQRVVANVFLPNPQQIYDLEMMPDGALAFCGDSIGWLDNGFDDGTRFFSSSYPCRRMLGDPRAVHYIQTNGRILRGVGAQYSDENLPGFAGPPVGDVNTVFVASANAIHVRTGTTWTDATLPSGCLAFGVFGIPGSIYGGATCPGDTPGTHSLLRWNGTSFDRITAAPGFNDARVLGDGTLVMTGGTGIARRFDGAGFVDLPIDGTAYGLSKDDFYIVPFSTTNSVFHVQGAVVSEIRIPISFSGVFEATPKALYAWDPSVRWIRSVPRSATRIPGSGL